MTELTPVTREQLAALAVEVPAEPAAEPRRAPGQAWRYGLPPRSLDLARWIQDHGLDVQAKQDWHGGKRWIFRVCPWNAEHRDRSAFIVQFASGAIAAGCHHNSCAGRDWHALRDLIEPGWRERGDGRLPIADFGLPGADAPAGNEMVQRGTTDLEPQEHFDEPVRPGVDQPGWLPGAMDGDLRWGGRSGNRAYLRHGQLRYTVTPGREGLRVKVAAGNRGSVEVVLDAEPGDPDLGAIAGRVAGALEAPVTDVRRHGRAAGAVGGPSGCGRAAAPGRPADAGRLRAWVTGGSTSEPPGRPRTWSARRSAAGCWARRWCATSIAARPTCWPTTAACWRSPTTSRWRCKRPCHAAASTRRSRPSTGCTTTCAPPRPMRAPRPVRQFSFSDPATSTVYASCGRAGVVARPGQKLEWRPNGADDIIFAAGAVLPEWDWQAEPLSPWSCKHFSRHWPRRSKCPTTRPRSSRRSWESSWPA